MRQLQKCLDVLSKEPRIAVLLEDLQRESDAMVDQLWKLDDKSAKEIISLKRKFIELFPAADDSNAKRQGEFDYQWLTTLGYFDSIVANFHRSQPTTYDVVDETLTDKLLRILQGKLKEPGSSTASQEEIDKFSARVDQLAEQHRRGFTRFVDDKLTSGSVALQAIRNFLFMALDPVGHFFDSAPRLEPRFSPRVPGGVLSYGLYDSQGIEPDSKKGRELANDVLAVKERARQLHEELRLRIGTKVSLLGLMNRFKHRCEWHDRVRLYALAQADGRKAEEVLTAELALWLFDNGMSPVSKPMMAGLQPDLTDPSFKFNLYVEAKQYSKAAKPYLIKGFHQLWDTVSGLRGTPYEVHEAFYVVFRRGGPRYVLPDLLQGEGWTTHLRLIDIAPSSERGSTGAKKPVVISSQEFLPDTEKIV